MNKGLPLEPNRATVRVGQIQEEEKSWPKTANLG
jgi:hypothetical protein